MGGYYSPPPKTPKEKCNEALEAFISSKKKGDLIEAYKQIKRTDEGLIGAFLIVLDVDLAKEFSEYEIEHKANVSLSSPSNLFSKKEDLTKKNMNELSGLIEFNYDEVPYLKDTENPKVTVGKNHFYSMDDEEKFVLTNKKGNWNTKIKEPTACYNLGLDGEQYVIKRKEDMGETNIKNLINMVLEVSKTKEITYEGFMEKIKADQFLLNINSGRVYNLTLGHCKSEGKEDLIQWEIEYAGYIPCDAFNKKLNSEKEIVGEILEIHNYMMQNYNKHDLEGFVLNLEPTTLTKFEWITGKVSDHKSKTKETPLVEEQTFFGDAV